MRESQAEIKAIGAELQTIRAKSSHGRSGTSAVLEPFPSRAATSQSPARPTPDAASRQGQLRSAPMHSAQVSQTQVSTAQVPQTQVSQTHSSQPQRAAVRQGAPAQNQTSPHSPHSPHPELRSPQLPPIQNEPATQPAAQDLAALVERLQRQSEFYIQQSRQLHPQFAQTVEQYLRRALPVLEAQVQHINQLSAVQEAALLELKATAEKVEQDWKTLEQSTRPSFEPERTIAPLCRYSSVAVPKIEQDEKGVYVVSNRSIDLFKAEREAVLTAQALRHWAERDKSSSPQSGVTSGKQVWSWLKDVLLFSEPIASKNPSNKTPAAPEAAHARTPQRAKRTRRSTSRRPQSRVVVNLKEGVALIIGAVMVRLVLDLLRVSFPGLWVPAVALLITPTAIAVYRTTRTPRSGFAWGYRLLFIMIGLLIGGRL